jgi:2-amino-4-hydroxy-6-hydroxymethyldihydropteridine pyrophosphokinase
MTSVNSVSKAHRAYLGLGSNMGDKAANICEAISRLQHSGATITATSRFYRTAPWGDEDQDWFVNACIAIETILSPHDLLKLCLDTERQMGRERIRKWGPRLIDIDILHIEGIMISGEDLTLPHPFVLQRAFVLVPLNDIASDLEIGTLSVREALARIDTDGISPLETF